MKNKLFEILSNALIFLMMISSIFWLLFGSSTGPLLDNGVQILKYFTTLSNIFVGLVALMSLIFLLCKRYPEWLKILKYVATGSVTLTLLTVLFYLGPTMGMVAMLTESLVFLHLLTPLAAIAHLFIFETKLESPKFKYTFFSTIPMVVYGIFYMSNLIANNGYGDVNYDWYMFGKLGLGIGILSFFLMLLASYAIGVALYFGYTKIKIKTSKE